MDTEKLRDDLHYYGRFGSQFLSNSNIEDLINNPKNFRKQGDVTVPMVVGRYFHVAMLEPHKLDDFKFIDVATRNNKEYREAVNSGEPLILVKEKRQIDWVIDIMKNNKEFSDLIYAKGNKFEEPAITEINGLQWKGKADIVHADFILDIKTTSDIRKFKYSANKYNYDSQAYIYEALFGKKMKFLVADKITGDLGIFDVTDDFLERGERKVNMACESYEKFFGENATEDVDSFVIRDLLI